VEEVVVSIRLFSMMLCLTTKKHYPFLPERVQILSVYSPAAAGIVRRGANL
jgi:hypothetical protein